MIDWRTAVLNLRFCLVLVLATSTIPMKSSLADNDRQVAPARRDDGWRRTVKGWEHVSSWYQPGAPTISVVHPVAIAVFVLVPSVTALAWSQRRPRRKAN